MSFFSKLFTRSITYIEWFSRDEQYDDILHVFGAIRVMPDEGDSFDIWRHAVIDMNNYTVINGLQQTGNDFSIKSPFAQRCIEHMSAQLNRKLKPAAAKEDSDDDDERHMDDDYIEPEPEFADLETNCEIPITEFDKNDSDTSEPKKLPRFGLVFNNTKFGDQERFTVQLYRSGIGMEAHPMKGMSDYFRYVLWLRKTNRIVVTYRKENWVGSGGMGFFVLNATTGELIHNDLIK